MKSQEKRFFTLISKDRQFMIIMEKITRNQKMNYDEYTYILTVALFFIEEFEKDQRKKSYIEFAYYIILKYSLTSGDYTALYDFSINFGFYPISKEILKLKLYKDYSLYSVLEEKHIDKYSYENHINTLEQKYTQDILLESNKGSICYVAPTSYGKSTIILKHIQKYKEANKKIGIIVPTKSLLIQTHRMIRENIRDRKIILHDEMYNDEDTFIAIITQERALRIMQSNNNLFFDILYIDEAHNIFDKDSRNILLMRLIRKNKHRNPNQIVFFLSPLISDPDNLRWNNLEQITEQRIHYNIKEPDYFEYDIGGEVLQYNRFLNTFYPLEIKYSNFMHYIIKNCKYKNFIYIPTPKKIEQFSRELFESLEDIILTEETMLLISELSELINEEFNVIKLLECGIVYLHGKMPESIKEYIEYQCSKNNQIKFIVANKVILEGINLPIDSLFIMSTMYLGIKGLVNLIGRVNRLNTIFNKKENNLRKLIPSIHFINSIEYNAKNGNMKNTIKKLRNGLTKDVISNPIIKKELSYLDSEFTLEDMQVINDEEFLLKNTITNEAEILKKKIIEADLHIHLLNEDSYYEQVLLRISKNNDFIDNRLDVLDKINAIFFNGFDFDFPDFEVSRLKEVETRSFYRVFISNKHRMSLKEQVIRMVNYWNKKIETGQNEFFIGETYGEIAKKTQEKYNREFKVYVDLSKKSYAEKINLAIVKIKMEEDFVGYKLNKFFVILYDNKIISEDEYNEIVYGTLNKDTINLMKTGISPYLLNKLKNDNQINNIYIDNYNLMHYNDEFKIYKENLSGFYKFELSKYL